MSLRSMAKSLGIVIDMCVILLHGHEVSYCVYPKSKHEDIIAYAYSV